MFYTVRMPSWFIKLNPSLVWRIPANEKELYLTFDDGPHETATTFILDRLKEFGAKATFFCIGKNVKTHPDIYQRIIKEGHAVGNHTFNHVDGWKTKTDRYIHDIEEAANYIDSKLFRPPYGRILPLASKKIRTQHDYKIIMWHILSGDFDKKLSPQKCLENVLLHAIPGSVIVFHDSTKAWERMSYALPKILKHFSDKGYSFKTISK